MAKVFHIRFDSEHLANFRRALTRINGEVAGLKESHPYNCAIDFKHLVVGNILSQKYATRYAPYWPGYAKWKVQKMMLGSHFWRLYGDLLKSVTTFKADGGHMAGIPAGVLDSGGKSIFGGPENLMGEKKYIAMYARTMEFGMNNHPPRPVFQPTTFEYRNAGFKVRGGEALNRIKMAWK